MTQAATLIDHDASTAVEVAQPRQVAEVPSLAPVDLTPDQMAYQLIRSGADFQSVREMVALTKEIAAEKARNAFNEAVASAKAEIPVIGRNAKGHNNKAYANFAAYAAVVDPVIAKHGLRYRFRTEQTDRITVTCVLSHKGGHSEENSLSGPADSSGNKNAIQAIGSTLTYLQRYTLIQALGLAAGDDDDGQRSDQTVDDGPISEDEAKSVRKLIADTNTDIEKFCAYLKIEAVPDIRKSQLKRATDMLEKKQRAQ